MGKASSKLSPELLVELSRSTRFDKKELQLWHRGFLKDCPRGIIDRKDFQKIYKQYFPFGDPSKYAGYVFRLMDMDGNGELDFVEFITALSVSARGDLDDRLSWAFQLYDLDEDGYIGKAEMLCIVDAIYRMIGTTEGLPYDEITPELRVAKVFSMMDLDNDGRLSMEEFKLGSKLDPSIASSLDLYSGLI
ncbi:hypothetical protein BASA50_003205 [Batrachochytrium salamandrivorans]|uniref:EF-hand domain-containing protein n=1 Tax=Batrachochytrium salamandrivorans TaxID=1357716 RepID=A0ABQ8FJ45_9FUNG|nr:hypothetical protein BASA60_000055 [Batrachochytrium salamandrivorans]KAH6563433.1 hypothetical protein BASA62_008527 [Batrachochytrium salamandrivorans]KAH6599177.1 hypothetical protein BASA50_003205 [Batrachochytrium salamandrivorans]KAH6601823.1 hypothetical protein BASA61_001716 [Batrachochytrium salamandrivorans]KAH9269167.1 hypothetical protein BASA83_008789 [Batrachochytrium salamandrivorans]